MSGTSDVIDLAFPVRGRRLSADHGYALYAAVSRKVPDAHGAKWLGIHPIRGPRRIDGAIELAEHVRLVLRLPIDRLGVLLPLAGASIDVAGDELWLGAPSIHPLEPHESLDARLVAIKVTRPQVSASGSLDKPALEARFRSELERQLRRLGGATDYTVRGRQQVTVGGRRVVGYSVRIERLKPDASLAIQRAGVGGKRRMGCGLFVATRPTAGR